MTIYVDPLIEHRNTKDEISRFGVEWCHMATDGEVEELLEMADKIGLKREWLQNRSFIPHFDLTPNKRKLAIKHGAEEVTAVELVKRCSTRLKTK